MLKEVIFGGFFSVFVVLLAIQVDKNNANTLEDLDLPDRGDFEFQYEGRINGVEKEIEIEQENGHREIEIENEDRRKREYEFEYEDEDGLHKHVHVHDDGTINVEKESHRRRRQSGDNSGSDGESNDDNNVNQRNIHRPVHGPFGRGRGPFGPGRGPFGRNRGYRPRRPAILDMRRYQCHCQLIKKNETDGSTTVPSVTTPEGVPTATTPQAITTTQQ